MIRHFLKTFFLLLPTRKLGESTNELFLQLFSYIQDLLRFSRKCTGSESPTTLFVSWQLHNLEKVPKCYLASVSPSKKSGIIATSVKVIKLMGKQSDSTYVSLVT